MTVHDLSRPARAVWVHLAAGVPASLLGAATVVGYKGFGAGPVTLAVVVTAASLAGGLCTYVGAWTRRRTLAVGGLVVFVATICVGTVGIELADWRGGPVWPAAGMWMTVVAAGVATARARTVADGAVVGACALAAVLSLVPMAVDTPGLLSYLVPVGLALAVSLILGARARASSERLRRVAAAARRAERAAMAHELHDLVAHEVAGISVLAQAGLATGRANDDLLRKIGDSAARALTDIREIVDTLRDPTSTGPMTVPSDIDTEGLRELARAFAASARGRVHVDIDEIPDGAPALIRFAAQRILSEALTNIRRHAANAAEVDIFVGFGEGAVILEVANGGPADGAEPLAGAGRGSGSGVQGMLERATSAGGSAEIGPSGEGWTVRATLPLGKEGAT